MGRRLDVNGHSVQGLASIATTGNTDNYFIVTRSGRIAAAYFSSLAALAQDGSNYVTFSITNLGQAGAGSTAILGAVDGNTTKTTTGAAISANTKRALTLSTTATDLDVVEGDRLRIRAAATGTLAGAVTNPVFGILIDESGQ